jgi:hypothetical protein
VRAKLFSTLLVLAALVSGAVQAQDLLDTTLTLGKEPDAVLLPFTVASTGSYRLAVTDFGTATGPSRLARVDAAVMRGSELVTTASVTVANTSGTIAKDVSLAAGVYRLVLIGQPNVPASRVGSAGVRIDAAVGGAVLLDSVQAFTAPPTPVPSPATFEHEIAVAAGTYTLEVTDFALPQALALVQTTVIRKSDGALLANVAGAAQVALTAGTADTFEVFVFAELGASVPRGLVGVNLREVGGAVVAYELHELGEWPYRYTFNVPATATLDATLTDVGFPLQLAALSAEVARDGLRAAPRLLPGTNASISAAAGDYTVYVDATAAATSAGSFGLRVTSPPATLLDTVRNVVTPGPVTDVEAIDTAFDVTAAGTYTLTLTDFGTSGFFDAFTSLELALTRDSQIVQTLSAAGSFTFAATPGRYSLAVLADPANATGEGLLGLRVVGGPANATLLDVTEAVGTDFISASVDVTSAQSVDVRLTDLGFPATFSSIKAAVTRGATRVGEITGAGSFSFPATPGSYIVNLLAAPNPTMGYGTFGLNVRVTPPLPVVTLTASASSVTVGGNVTLNWSATNATACTATGGWSGSRATSGTATTSALNADTTFTLTCTGIGGSDDAAVAVAVTAAQRSSGGGGAADAWLLALLAAAGFGMRRRFAAR